MISDPDLDAHKIHVSFYFLATEAQSLLLQTFTVTTFHLVAEKRQLHIINYLGLLS